MCGTATARVVRVGLGLFAVALAATADAATVFSISKTFGAASIPLNGTTTLTFAISAGSSSGQSGMTFTDSLPAGLVVANPSNLTGDCGGLVTATPGAGTVSLTGGTLSIGTSCTISVDVTGTTAGVKNNTVALGSRTASASLTVVAPPTVAIGFAPAFIPLFGTSTLTFTITNPPANAVALTGVGFSDPLPTGLTASTATLAVCNTSVTVVSSGLVMSGGSIAAGGSCTFSVTVTGNTSGQFVDTVSSIHSDNGGSGPNVTATVVVATPPSLSLAFAASTVAVGGATALSFTLTNPAINTGPLSAGFSLPLPAGLVVATPPGVSNPCGGTVAPVAGGNFIGAGSVVLAPGASCTISVNVSGTGTSAPKMVTGLPFAAEAGNGTPVMAFITVVVPPTLNAFFVQHAIPLGSQVLLILDIYSDNAVTINAVGVTATLSDGLVIATPSSVTGTCGGGTITATAGTHVFSLSGASMTGFMSCSLRVSVAPTAPGLQTVTAGPITSNETGPSNTSNDTVKVEAPPSLTMAFGAAQIPVGGVTSLTFTISNPAANLDPLTGIAFSENLPTGLTVATPNGAATTCGGTLFAASSVIDLSAVTLAPASACTLIVNVTGTSGGSYVNTTYHVSSTNGGIGGVASASLTVVNPATISMAFSPPSIPVGATTSLQATLSNTNGTALTGVGFVDILPPGVVIASPSGLLSTCGGTVSAPPGSSFVNLSGVSLAAAGTCALSLNVRAATPGLKVNAAWTVSNEGGVSSPVNTTLSVFGPPSIAKTFGVPSIALNAATTLTFVIYNPNVGLALSGVAFSDSLPAGLVVATPNGLIGGCGGTITALAGSGTVGLTNGSLAAGATCVFSVTVKAVGGGTKNNITGNGGATESGPGNAATATLTVPCGAIAIQPLLLPAASLQQPYTQALTTTGAFGAAAYTKSSGILPPGVTLNASGIAGTPTALGSFHFTVLATDEGGCTGTRTYDLEVNHEILAATGAGAGGGPHVRSFVPRFGAGTLDGGFFAYEGAFAGGVRVAVGDVNGDGVADIVTAPGPGRAPVVRIFDGVSHMMLREFVAGPATFTGGLFVAVGDVDSDAFGDIVVGLDAGAGPQVQVFSGATGAVIRNFNAYAPSFAGGVRVAVGDTNGDGYADIITAPGPGGGPHVQVFSGYDGSVLRSFFAYSASFTGGVFVAAGDVDGDGLADIVTGPDAGIGPDVVVFRGSDGTVASTFPAYDPSFTGGVRVAAADVNHDGRADIITAPGPGGGPHVRVRDGATGAELVGLFAYAPSFAAGVFVGAAAPISRMTIDGPPAGGSVGSTFTVSGWALQELAPAGTGVDTIHIWAFPVAGGAPSFLGVATVGDARADVAAFYGGRYLKSGYHLNASGLAAGDYYLVVYVHSSVSQTFNQRAVIRITVQ